MDCSECCLGLPKGAITLRKPEINVRVYTVSLSTSLFLHKTLAHPHDFCPLLVYAALSRVLE